MTTTTLILLLYVLPMIISGLFHYFDKSTKTLGNFMEMWWAIFLPFINSITAICVITGIFMEYLEDKNWLQRIKDIKIKSVIIFFFLFLLLSCGKLEDKYKKKFLVSKSDDDNWTTSGIIECDSVTMQGVNKAVLYTDGQKVEIYSNLIKIFSNPNFDEKTNKTEIK